MFTQILCLDRKPRRVVLLIEKGADLCLTNKAGLSAFHFINKKVPQCMSALSKYSFLLIPPLPIY